MLDYDLHEYPNGIRLLHKQVPHTKIAHCGFLLDIGSRDERPEQYGLAHFWEHMAFKGTEKRKSFHILNRLENVGGELNAYTTKEKICFYASLLSTHFERAFELLTDLTFHSVFPLKEIEKERGVILEEMAMYVDAPEDAIIDDFDAVVFGEHALGHNILGTRESVSGFQQADFQQFLREQVRTDRLVFTSVSNLPFKQVKRMADKYLAALPAQTGARPRTPFSVHAPTQQRVEKPITQAHCLVGGAAYALPDARRLPFFMLTNILGGPGMNSRLNMGVREKYGLVYSIDATYSPYTDTGLFGIYFATEKRQLERTTQLVLKELRTLREKALTTSQLHVAKQQLMGQLAMAEESNGGMMQLLGKSTLDLGRVESLNEIFDQIQRVTSAELLELANDILREDQLSTLQYVPQGKKSVRG
ncbi:insulinase family protein [Hymenobacter busanensis]|uniref:Insulinase family protein n=1 Tax=Hymenobacter busanensis TaxID=2607656 RepID=A0A7L5A3N3_9BACT|nr:pitrilysin family protein [Hymenobacter busanensis]KAA9338401.1 insulinase family protein [Hymenobacter busanensis]QHJ09172.1 insulinase family protein [Hymenobacter busanensis]